MAPPAPTTARATPRSAKRRITSRYVNWHAATRSESVCAAHISSPSHAHPPLVGLRAAAARGGPPLRPRPPPQDTAKKKKHMIRIECPCVLSPQLQFVAKLKVVSGQKSFNGEVHQGKSAAKPRQALRKFGVGTTGIVGPSSFLPRTLL